jgi:DNA ligase-1
MLHFSELFTAIDQTTSTNEKIDALVTYFGKAPADDVIWCVALLSGRRPKRTVKRQEIWQWSSEISGLPHWLLDETYHIVGDLAETISLVLPEYPYSATTTLSEIMRSLIALEQENEDTRKDFVTGMWLQLSRQELLVFNKLITGGF